MKHQFPISESEFVDRRKRHLKPLLISAVVALSAMFVAQYFLKPERTGLTAGACMAIRYGILGAAVLGHIWMVKITTARMGLCCPECSRSINTDRRLDEAGRCINCQASILSEES